MTLANPAFTRIEPLPVLDRVTGLRRSGIRHPDGQPPIVTGCRWCGLPQPAHGSRWVQSQGWHTWAAPTAAQQAARLTARGARTTRPAAAVRRRPVCDEMNHDSRGHETFCQEDPDDDHPVHDDGNGTTWARED
jgi:hypothetical protein